MYYSKPDDYVKGWRVVEEKDFDEWLLSPDSPDWYTTFTWAKVWEPRHFGPTIAYLEHGKIYVNPMYLK